ncbi:MAG TPA: nuclear transport factor 2 family protein [Acidimicrobiales bacterium]
MIDEALAGELARHWDEGWNGYDLETIMAPFAEDVVFSSPFVARATGDRAKTTIEGREALRAYIAGALERAPGIRYTLDATYAGTESVVLVYTCHLPDGTDKPGADSMRVDDAGQVVEWRCHYTPAFNATV